MENLSNDKKTELQTGVLAGATSITVKNSTGWPAVKFRIRVDDELMLVTNKGAGTQLTWTVERGIEGTTPADHLADAVVTQVLTVGGLLQYIIDNYPLQLSNAVVLAGASQIAGLVTPEQLRMSAEKFGGGTPVSKPSGFTLYTPPFSIRRTGVLGAYTYTTDYSPESKRPTPTSTIYVGLGGNNNNDGLTYATRVRSFSLAIAMASALGGVVRILFEAGTYLYTNTQARSGQPSLNNPNYPDNWASLFAGNAPACDLVIEPYDGTGVAELVFNKNVTWNATSDANIYVTNALGASNVGTMVADLKFLDPEGQPIGLYSVFTVADGNNPWPELNAAHAFYGNGAKYYNNTTQKMYIRTRDSRAPDAQIRMHDTGQSPGWLAAPTATRTIWAKNLKFRGGGMGFKSTALGASGIKLNSYWIDCAFTHSGGNGGQTGAWLHQGGGGEIIHYRTVSSYNVDDCLAYYGATEFPNAVEIDFVSRYSGNGQTSGTVNASTGHNNTSIMRINGKYYECLDAVINDIDTCQSWNLGCEGSNRRGDSGTETSVVYRCGFPGKNFVTLMWLDGCRVIDGALGPATYKTACYAGGILSYTNLTFTPTAGPGTGTVQSY